MRIWMVSRKHGLYNAHDLLASFEKEGHEVYCTPVELIEEDLDSFLDEREIDLFLFRGQNGKSGSLSIKSAERGIPTFIIEQGHLNRRIYHQIGVARINGLPLGECDSSRRKIVLGDFRSVLEAFRGPEISILGQKPGDAQHDIASMVLWAEGRLGVLRRSFSSRAMVFRPHPLDPTPMSAYEALGFDRVDHPDNVSFDATLNNSWVVATHNSNGGCVALSKGIPVICHDSAPYAAAAMPWSVSQISEIDELLWSNVFNRIACAQYNAVEMRDGTARAYLERQMDLWKTMAID